MLAYEYKTFTKERGLVENALNELGAQGWRLHTADLHRVYEGTEDCETYIYIVMDRAYETEDPVYEDTGLQAIEMKVGPS